MSLLILLFAYYCFYRNNLPKSALTTPKLVGSVGRYKSAVNFSKEARSSSLNPHILSNVFSIVHLGNVSLSCSHSLLPSAQSPEFANCLLLLRTTIELKMKVRSDDNRSIFFERWNYLFFVRLNARYRLKCNICQSVDKSGKLTNRVCETRRREISGKATKVINLVLKYWTLNLWRGDNKNSDKLSENESECLANRREEPSENEQSSTRKVLKVARLAYQGAASVGQSRWNRSDGDVLKVAGLLRVAARSCRTSRWRRNSGRWERAGAPSPGNVPDYWPAPAQ